MNNLINGLVNWVKAHTLLLTILAALLFVLLLFFYGITLKNHLSNWWYERGTNQAHEEIDRLTTEAIKAKGIAAEALKALEEEKKVTAAEKQKRELAESLLNDRSKTTTEKLKLYEEALNKAPTVSAPASVDDLCQRAASLGISCAP